ncbi:hypothetical protein QFZ81_006403 [Paenibacillus sp. V4I9]|nr:hypothetical protein [Paenibacillus sp. V4I9]
MMIIGRGDDYPLFLLLQRCFSSLNLSRALVRDFNDENHRLSLNRASPEAAHLLQQQTKTQKSRRATAPAVSSSFPSSTSFTISLVVLSYHLTAATPLPALNFLLECGFVQFPQDVIVRSVRYNFVQFDASLVVGLRL